MTDYENLMDEFAESQKLTFSERHKARSALQSAIEALQKEVSTLDVLLEECKMDWSGDVTQIKAEHKHEIQAMQAKLAAMGKVEPVAWQFRTNGKHWHVVQVCPPDDAYDEGTLSPLYAAPKALAPLTDEQLRQMRTDARASEDCANEYWFILFARAIEAAHGIGGTP